MSPEWTYNLHSDNQIREMPDKNWYKISAAFSHKVVLKHNICIASMGAAEADFIK